jgi:hypothetical protein
MLRKLREEGQPAQPKFFNAVVRGRKTVIIPNRGEYLKVDTDAPVVTAPVNITLLAKQNIPMDMSMSHFYRTRKFFYKNNIAAGDSLEFLATDWKVNHNGEAKTKYQDWQGLFFECAKGDSRFNIDLISEDSDLRPQPSARILIDMQEWEADKGALLL